MRHPEVLDWRKEDEPDNVEYLDPFTNLRLVRRCEISEINAKARNKPDIIEPPTMITWSTRTSRIKGRVVGDVDTDEIFL